MRVDSGRLTNPTRIDEADTGRMIEDGTLRVIQFDQPPEDVTVLDQINALCRSHGAKLQVRFYGYYRSIFDGRLLRHLPDVVSLATDCLSEIENEEVFAELPRLRRLSFGVHTFDRSDFVGLLPLEQLTELALGENRKRNFDLAPLKRCAELEQLFVRGHSKNAEAIASLPRLAALTLSGFPKRSTLEFLNPAPGLRQLRLLLGARDSIAELSHQGIERLGICWVRGLGNLGPLHRFSGLQELSVEDQLRLETIDVRDTPLRRLRIFNCKTLAAIVGLEELEHLNELRVGGTKVDLQRLRDASWGPAMDTVALYSGSNRWNEETRRLLEQRGYREMGGSNWLWA